MTDEKGSGSTPDHKGAREAGEISADMVMMAAAKRLRQKAGENPSVTQKPA